MSDTKTTNLSPYREAERRFLNDEEGLYDYLRTHRLDDLSLCLGYYLKRAERDFNLTQADVARMTEIHDRDGRVIEAPITRGYLSQILTGHRQLQPTTLLRLARALQATPLDFFLALGWIDPADLTAYALPYGAAWQPIAAKLVAVPDDLRPRAIALIGAVVDTILAGVERFNKGK